MTGRFLQETVDIHELAGHGGRWFCTLTDVTYLDADGTRYHAPAGTLTDFASTPRIVWTVFPKMGRYNRATVVHDLQCTERQMPSAFIHGIFRRGVRACGCSWATVLFLWLAVRLFGPRF